jgi:4-hydroxybenzoate polyprenyltransferase
VSGGSTREGQTFAGRAALVRYANLVKLPHTLFALPFALVGAVLASYVKDVTTATILWVALAFASARYAAMAFNRIVDRGLDAANPRTAMREIPAGVISVREASIAVVLSSVLFLASAWQLNPLCFALAPVALIWVLAYSYTKRFTRWAHLALGLGLGIAPVGGYLAVTGAWSDPWWMLPVLAGGVMTWVGGFDVLYALQDLDFDRQAGLHSIPAALGVRRALVVARVLHAGTVIALAAVGSVVGAGWLYWTGVAVVAALLLFEHSLVRVDDLSRLDAAFFTMNAIISIAFFGFVLAERLVR